MGSSFKNSPQPRIQLPGYTFVEGIYRGLRCIVYRAIQIDGHRPVIIKALYRDQPSFSELIGFRNQYTIAQNLSVGGIVRSLSLEPYHHGYALVMEDVNGISLQEYAQLHALSLEDVLAIAVQLTDILHSLHQHRVIHKDIQPANILITPESRQIHLIDFSIASLLPKETQTIQSLNKLERTLAYLASEQTGCMNRGIDYRADYYALRITLDQLLTGTLPFQAHDALELVHAHLAKTPNWVHQVNETVPKQVSAIVTKLMAKNAEDCCRSALGLKHPLEQCQVQWERQAAIADFTLGRRNVCDRVPVAETLHSRATEVKSIADALHHASHAYFSGQALSTLQRELSDYSQVLEKLKEESSKNHIDIYRQTIEHLQDPSRDSGVLVGSLYDEIHMLPLHHQANDLRSLYDVYLNRGILCYWFDNWEKACESFEYAERYLEGAASKALVPIFHYYYALAMLAKFSCQSEESEPCWKTIIEHQDQLKHHADHASENYLHKWYLVEAEKYRVTGQKLEAIECYEHAIAGAKAGKFVQEEALANELFAKFYLAWGKQNYAALHMQEAYCACSRWGATAKTNDLEQRYPDLLRSTRLEWPLTNSLATLERLSTVSVSAHSSPSSKLSTGDNCLDTEAILKAIQLLSKNVHIDELLTQLAQLVLQNSRADKLIVILPNRDNSWHIRAIATPETIKLSTEPLTENLDSPIQLLQYVKNTREIVAIDDLDTDLPIIDVYLQQHQPRSVLCLPVLHQGNLRGLLYLQNQLMAEAFSRDCLLILNFLCTQAAIALENARLFEEQQQLANSLQLKNSFLKAQQESSLDGLLVIDENRRVSAYNQRFVSIWNIPEEVIETDDEYRLLDSVLDQLENPTEFLEGIEYLYNHPEKSIHDELILKNQRILERYSAPVTGECGNRIWCFRDITDRKQTERALHNSQARFRRMAENVPGMIYRYVLYADGRDELTCVSSQVQELFEIEPEQALQAVACVWERVHPDDVLGLQQALQSSAQTLEPMRSEHRLQLPKAGLRWVQLFAQPERLGNGDVAWDGVVVDISDRKATEQKLAAKQNHLKALLNNIPHIAWLKDSESRFIAVNEPLAQMLNSTPAEMIGKTDFDFSSPEIARSSQEDDFRVLESGQRKVVEEQVLHRDGSLGWLETTKTPFYDAEGQFAGIVGIAADISERKAAEKLLKMTQYGVHNSSDGIIWLTVDANIIYANPAICELSGYSQAELTNLSIFDISPDIPPENWVADWEAVKVGNRPSIIESHHQAKDGRLYPVEIVGNYFELDNVEYQFVRIRDISDRKHAERLLSDYNSELERQVEERTQALQESEERLRLALSATKQGFFDLNLQTGEAVVSSEYALMLGYEPTSFQETDATLRSRLHVDDRTRTIDAYKAYESGQATQYQVEFRLQTQQGDWKWILETGQFVEWNEAGQPTRLLGTHTDISDSKFAEIQLAAQNKLLAKIAQGQPLSEILHALIQTVENNLDEVCCSVLLLDKDNRLRHGAAPSLPDDYNQLADGVLIGEGAGSCGTSAFRNQMVVVEDIATDPLWSTCKDLALSHGLRACWSTPITAHGGEVLGTFAMYYPQPRSPQTYELDVIAQMARIAGIAIEREQAEARLRQSEATLLKAQQVAHVGNWELDIASQTITWSPEMFRIYGLEPSTEAPSYREYLQMLPAETSLQIQEYVERAINRGTPYTLEYSRTRADGAISHHECRAEVEQNEQGQTVRLFGTTLDTTDLKQTEQALQNLVAGTAATIGQDFFPALVSHISTALEVPIALVTQFVDQELQSLAFVIDGELQANFTYDLLQTPCRDLTVDYTYHCPSHLSEHFPNHPHRAMGMDSYLGVGLRDRQGHVLGSLCIFDRQPLQDPERAQQILNVFGSRAVAELERQRAEVVIRQQLAAIEAAIDGISILQNGVYLYVNQAYLSLFGYEHTDELVGKSWKRLYSPDAIRRFEQDVFPHLTRGQGWQGEAIATRKDGSTFAQGVSLTLTDDGLMIGVCRDISELKQAQALITHNALHDALTGLPNRSLLLERLELAIQRARQHEEVSYAILFLDLDRFKVINDSLGHLVGDQLLVAIAERLKTHVQQTDLVARLGGDEFLVLLEDINGVEEVAQIAERILAECQIPLILNGHQIFTSISIGIVLGTKAYQQATDLIRDADIAMYQAKTNGRNAYRFFDAEMHEEVINRLTLETDLRKALDQQEFVIYYQPIFELFNRQLIGFEALLRWQHPTRGLISPDQFIPIAEETGFIQQIDSWVLHQACQQVSDWQKQFPNFCSLKISINLSAKDLYKSGLIQEVDDVLTTTKLSSGSLTLEITESLLIKDIDQIADLLMQITAKDVQISIDDFGTGYSSLNYLHRLPVHNLKIDRSFVGQMESEIRNHRVVDTIITLGRQLGLTAIAEGIETPQQLDLLRQLNCQFGQGYLFSKPLSAQDAETRFLNH